MTSGPTEPSAPRADQPDVVLIFMDDMTHWALTEDWVRTPHLDRLRARSVHFQQAVNLGSTMPAVCLPARQMLLSGLTLFHAERRFDTAHRLGATLGSVGYRTCFTGKWHNGADNLRSDYEVLGAHEVGGMFESGPRAYGRPADTDHWDPTDPREGGHWLPADLDHPAQHSSERWAQSALSMLAADESRPVFLHVAFHAPHDPRQAPAVYQEMYDRNRIPVPPNAWSRHPFDNGELDIRDEHLAPWPRTADAVRLHRHEYAAIVSHADAQIGRILEMVEHRASSRGTVVVFSGDHGLALGEHGLMGKQNLYDHSVRVPLMISGPDVRPGVSDALVYSSSIYATICDLIGVPAPDGVEFGSLLPHIMRSAEPDPVAQLGVYRDLMRSVRTPNHKLITYLETGRIQLFDLSADPAETHDLADDPACASVRAELEQELQHLRRWVDDPTLRRQSAAESGG